MITDRANVYKAGVLAADLIRTPAGVVFEYRTEYLAAGGARVASTLPAQPGSRLTPAGAVPPYFAGLLPEGRRLSTLRRAVKTSADDELSLLAAIGDDTVGDVKVAPEGTEPTDAASVTLPVGPDSNIRFADLLTDSLGSATQPTLAGVQDKASAAMISLPVARQHERHILKLDPPEYRHLVRNEAFFLTLAKRSRVPVPEHRIIHDSEGVPGLLVTRFDRTTRDGAPFPLAVEDGCQSLDRWPADKYAVAMEDVVTGLMALSSAPLVAARDLLRQLVFAWLTGNGDLHAKNLSVVATLGGEFRIAPAYDLPSTLFYGDDTLALSVTGRDTLTRARLHDFAATIGLRPALTDRVVDELLASTAGLADEISAGVLPFDGKLNAKTARQLRQRRRVLTG